MAEQDKNKKTPEGSSLEDKETTDIQKKIEEKIASDEQNLQGEGLSGELSKDRTHMSEHRTRMSEHRTGLSEHRTELSEVRTDRSNERTALSYQRTALSYERTLMSWIRTAASLITEIGDMKRYKNFYHLNSFIGLLPMEHCTKLAQFLLHHGNLFYTLHLFVNSVYRPDLTLNIQHPNC